MQLDLRRKAVGGWWAGALGALAQSGETDIEGSALPTDSSIDFSSGEMAEPGFNITTAPLPEIAPAELAAEQARAASWLSTTFPAALNTTTQLLMSATQIASGVAAGAVKPSSTCPSGFMLSGSGACVQKTAMAGAAPGGQLIAGVDNKTLAIVAGGLIFIMLIAGGGKRR